MYIKKKVSLRKVTLTRDKSVVVYGRIFGTQMSARE